MLAQEFDTVIIRNLPVRVRREEIIEALVDMGFSEDTLHFVYLPIRSKHAKRQNTRGYCFVGFRLPDAAESFLRVSESFRLSRRNSEKAVFAEKARVQGLVPDEAKLHLVVRPASKAPSVATTDMEPMWIDTDEQDTSAASSKQRPSVISMASRPSIISLMSCETSLTCNNLPLSSDDEDAETESSLGCVSEAEEKKCRVVSFAQPVTGSPGFKPKVLNLQQHLPLTGPLQTQPVWHECAVVRLSL